MLEGLEAVRKRPGMYVGSTDSRGLMHCLWEIIDNSVDEALAGHGDRIDVVLLADGSVEVRDDGRGIPVDEEPKTGLSGVEVVFTKLHAGGKFGGGSYTASGGLHGVGASVVNALSARLDVEVDRGGKVHAMSFRRGEPGIFEDPRSGPDPDAPFTPFLDRSELRVAGRTKRGVTGTRVRYWADRQIFIKEAGFAYDELVQRARQTSYLVPGLTLVIRDERGLPDTPGAEGPHEETFCHRGGIVEYVDYLGTGEAVTDVWRLAGSGHFHETVPVLDAQGHMSPTEVERECVVDIAVRWDGGYDTKVRSFVNIIATPKGGTHVAGLRGRAAQDVQAAGGAERAAAEGQRQGRPAGQGGRPGRPHRHRDRPAGRAAVRGPDQGGARHERRPRHRGQGGRARADQAADLDQARREAAGGPAAGEGRRGDEVAGQRPPAQGDPAAQERPRVLLPAGQARRLPHGRRRAQRAVHRRG